MVTEGLDMPGFKGIVAGRRRYVRSESGEDIGVELPENQSLQSTLERSWYWGSQVFREHLYKDAEPASL
ncbi:MAG: hypothetical protein P1U89_26750 [Verrucomicrobiales bacterium]|nr:hypothetical protein [Verrucomicrobiales bacterium]